MENIKELLLNILKDKNYIPSDIDTLYEKLNLTTPEEFTLLAKALNSLEDEFIILHNKKGCFALLETFKLVKGIIDVKEAGYGFIDLEDGSIFVRKDNLKGAITGDEVLASTYYDRQGRIEGSVERIIKRGTTEVVGKLQKYRNKYVLRSVNKNIDLWIFIKSSDLKKAKVDDFVKVKITREAMLSSPSLKLICVFATGFDNIDIAAARELGVAVCNVPGYSTDSIVLFTVANVLALYSRLYEYNNFVRSGEYSRSGVANKLTPVYHELRGKTWGIVGLGNIGRAVAKVAEAFGADVVAYKRTPVEDYECVSLDELCKRSDIITLHCPLNEGTRNLITKDRISMMKKDVIIVNEARGAVVNESDIKDAILNGEKRFDSESAQEIYSSLKFLPNTHFGYVPCLCGKKCETVCFNHLKEAGKI